MKFIPVIFYAFLLVFNCTANSSSVTPSSNTVEEDNPPSRRQLRRNFYEKGEILVVYNAQNKTALTEYDLILTNIAKEVMGRRGRNIQIKHKLSSQVSEEEIKNSVLFIIGTAETNPLVSRLSTGLPLSFSENGIRFNEKDYHEKTDVLSCSYFPNPENKNLPFLFLTGNDDTTILNFLKEQIAKQRLINQNMDFEIYRNNDKIVIGGFDREWNLDSDVYFDFTKGTESILTTEHFEIISHDIPFADAELNTFSTMMEESVKDMRTFFDRTQPLAKVAIHLYKSAEEKGLLLGNTEQAHLEIENKKSHLIYNDQYKNNFLQKENIIFLRELLGEPNQTLLEEGLAIYFTKHWQREGYLYWVARLAESQNTLVLTDFFNEKTMEYESPIIKEGMAAALVSFLIEDWGKDTFIKKYVDWNPTNAELKKIENDWQIYLQKLVNQYPKKLRKQKAGHYLKGFNFGHEGYSIYNGYLSKLATKSLEKQASLGANAIAIVPYTGMRDPQKPVPLRISRYAGSENVQGIVHSAYEARKLGMASMLKPQIWLSRSWPGDIKMNSQKEWDQFFTHYHRWILHFALIAEIHEIEMFCVGVEFSYATLAKEKEWRKIFRSLRGLYQGKMTYAANWGKEFEQVGFWDELDFIGLNCYYPLSKNENPSDKDLKNNFRKVKDKIKKVYSKHNKPIVFTEIGFRSIRAPWKNPHAEDDQNFKAEDQARCYEIIFDGIKDEPWCQGILWWKFPSYLDYRGLENNSFTPNNKTAEKVVKKWFSR